MNSKSRGSGGHGRADPVMLAQIFSPIPPPDPCKRAATHLDGAASVLVGIAANMSMQTNEMVHIDNLLPLSSLMDGQAKEQLTKTNTE